MSLPELPRMDTPGFWDESSMLALRAAAFRAGMERAAEIARQTGAYRDEIEMAQEIEAAIRSEIAKNEQQGTERGTPASNGEPEYSWMTRERGCSFHPDAPHGFDRNASHNADRYVCECESWTPPEHKRKIPDPHEGSRG
jgi:hypothetical protein